jgi:hypothetical protein
MPDALKIVTSVASQPEAQLVVERLKAAGISAIAQRTIGGPEWGLSGAQNVFVDEQDLERARELLASEEGSFSDEELGRLSEEAVQHETPRDPPSKTD